MAITVFESEATRLVAPSTDLVRLANGFKFTEGPVWDHVRSRLLFSDIPANTIYHYSDREGVQIYRQPSHFSNGLCLDCKGRLLTCEHQTRRVTRENHDGTITVLAHQYEGRRLNAPNDIIVAADGSILFTDPHYGLMEGLGGPAEQEQPWRGVYHLRPDLGEPRLLVDDFDAPNGLALSPDESILYINDSVHEHIRSFRVSDDWQLSGGEVLITLKGEADEEGVPDGMKLDENGNIFCTGSGGIWICNPSGKIMARISIPEVAANLAWGDHDRRSLYVTASTGLYRLRCLVRGSNLK
ncbi:MAG: SMP-30/gluconolactonase/LRE family protein [Anaerolineae bacterium]|nr:SMP-30/gluconolactonase/LRE family protein [Anaerolineae bacterium]